MNLMENDHSTVLSYSIVTLNLSLVGVRIFITDYSTVTEQSPTVGNLIDLNTNHNLVMTVRLTSSNLWLSPYSQYQQELFDIIRNFKENDDWTFKQISDWLVDNDYRTPRDKTFTHKHVWSMYTKKKRSIERFNREYEPVIKNVDIDIVD